MAPHEYTTYLLIPKAGMVRIINTFAENGSGEAEATIGTKKKMGERRREVDRRIHRNCELSKDSCKVNERGGGPSRRDREGAGERSTKYIPRALGQIYMHSELWAATIPL